MSFDFSDQNACQSGIYFLGKFLVWLKFSKFSKLIGVSTAVDTFLPSWIVITFQLNKTLALFETELINECLHVPDLEIPELVSNIDISSFLFYM